MTFVDLSSHLNLIRERGQADLATDCLLASHATPLHMRRRRGCATDQTVVIVVTSFTALQLATYLHTRRLQGVVCLYRVPASGVTLTSDMYF